MTRVKTGSNKKTVMHPTQTFTRPTYAIKENKQMGNVLQPNRMGENHDLASMLKTFDAECRNCAPTSPLECLTRCQVYKLKNELRQLRETMDNPNYIKELFNVLKNETRLHILKAIVNGRYSVSQLQQELKKNGYSHSQDTINEEYLQPLMAVGLATESRDEYYATTFGGRLTNLLGVFPEFAEVLPAHSECYEETLLRELLSGPKTFEEIETLISSKIASRILKRLRSVGLIETPEERDYIFFFKSKRDPSKETLGETEHKVYDCPSNRRNLCWETCQRNRAVHAKNLQVSQRLERQKTCLHKKNPQSLRFNQQRRNASYCA